MILKDRSTNKYFEFYPVSYEFPNITRECKEYNENDANWINIVFRTVIDEKQFLELIK